jgi:hypothetical protein
MFIRTMMSGAADLRKKYRKFLNARGKTFRAGRGAWPEELTNHFNWWKDGRDGPEPACSLLVQRSAVTGKKRKARPMPGPASGSSSSSVALTLSQRASSIERRSVEDSRERKSESRVANVEIKRNSFTDEKGRTHNQELEKRTEVTQSESEKFLKAIYIL